MSLDGGTVAIDWELHVVATAKTRDQQEQDIRNGPIDKPVIIIIHGLNNHANFGYIRSMMSSKNHPAKFIRRYESNGFQHRWLHVRRAVCVGAAYLLP
jgi:predicted alpha/beta-fold hydrolase